MQVATQCHNDLDQQIPTSVWEKVRAIRATRYVSTLQEDSIAVAMMVLNV